MKEYLVFTTPICPNCPPVKSYMSKLHEDKKALVTFIDAITPSGRRLVAEYKVYSVPTIIEIEEETEIHRYHSVLELDTQ